MRKENVYFGDGGLDWRNGVSDCIALYYHRNTYLALHNRGLSRLSIHVFSRSELWRSLKSPRSTITRVWQFLETSILCIKALSMLNFAVVLQPMDELSRFYDLDRFLIRFFVLTVVKQIYAVLWRQQKCWRNEPREPKWMPSTISLESLLLNYQAA